MIRALVLSDTHLRGDTLDRMPAVVWELADEADVILHAGDVVAEEVLAALAQRAPVHAVLGNNDHDLHGHLAETLELELAGVSVAMVHDSGPRSGRERRMARRFPAADVVVFGHSHDPVLSLVPDGPLLLNPGSPTQRRRQPVPTVAWLELDSGSAAGPDARIVPVGPLGGAEQPYRSGGGWSMSQPMSGEGSAAATIDGQLTTSSTSSPAPPSAVASARRVKPLMAWRRVVLVGAAALMVPAVLLGLSLTGSSVDVPIIVVVAAVLFVVALVRIRILVVDVQEHHKVYEQLQASIREERRRFAENQELLVSLRERQILSERLFRIQRKISTRVPLQDVLDAITSGAAELLRDEVVGLRLVTAEDRSMLQMVSSVGVPDDFVPELSRLRVGEGVGGRAVSENRLCIQESYADWSGALQQFRDEGLCAAMGAPVHLEGRPIGSLVVASYRPGRKYSAAEQDTLAAFAQHVSLALNDARALQTMNEALDQAVHQAMHDGLTGLPNRACFYDRTDQALRTANRDGSSTGVLLFDLDRFKEINDTLGHRYGDRVLRGIGPRIQANLRDCDTLARLGGDEFCVLLPDVGSEAEAAEVAARIVRALEEPFDIDGMLLAVEASCGIVVAPQHGHTADLLLQRADVAMYLSKTSHGDPVVYSDELDVNTPERLALLGELRSAIARGELVLHVQPHVDLRSHRVTGAEALVRWDHPRLGLLGPDRFIPIAEDTGLIKPLTAWVLDAALGELSGWLAAGMDLHPEFSVAINVSTRSLLDDSFADEVIGALSRAGIPASRLVLEVTETTIMADPARAHRLLTELSEAGVRFSIDDFGTGYSSLASLKVLPVHQLKIDKSFVRHMHEAPDDATIVGSIIDLGHTLGLTIVAEGVEWEATRSRLAERGCDIAQGYLIARPMPPAELPAWLRQHDAATPHQPVA